MCADASCSERHALVQLLWRKKRRQDSEVARGSRAFPGNARKRNGKPYSCSSLERTLFGRGKGNGKAGKGNGTAGGGSGVNITIKDHNFVRMAVNREENGRSSASHRFQGA